MEVTAIARQAVLLVYDFVSITTHLLDCDS